MPEAPIQIVLNAENFLAAPPAGGGGRNKDFFAERDVEFRAHKARLAGQVAQIRQALAASPYADEGVAKVVLRRSALAKSHRPVRFIFKPNRTPVIGGEDLGVLLVEASSAALREVEAAIQGAEDETRMEPMPTRPGEVQRVTPNPTRQRSEVGAIERVELYGPSDKRNFSVDDAVRWLADKRCGGAYQVELFEEVPPPQALDTLSNSRRRLFQSFSDGLGALGRGISIKGARLQPRRPSVLIRLERSDQLPSIQFLPPTSSSRPQREIAPVDLTVARHAALIQFLDSHPLVKRIRLPGVVVRSPASVRQRPTSITVPHKTPEVNYPTLGVIDGGLAPCLMPWTVGRWDPVAAADQDHEHGTFIGGLLVAGQAWNGREVCPEPDGAALVDIAVFPRDGRFDAYYGSVAEFLDEVANAVQDSRARFNTRVFNFSLNIEVPVSQDRYSAEAFRLDQIAEENNAIICISAGNLASSNFRPEWPGVPTDALTQLATIRNDGLQIPAESVRNISVAALNTPGVDGTIGQAPARYSRRGPGLRAGVKPDLAHCGGVGSPTSTHGTGLYSVHPAGNCVDGSGTSYAAPVVAKTLAILASQIEGEVSRETLIALAVHQATIPEPLRHKLLRGVARHLVGFGVPSSAEETLRGGDTQITLVFASRLKANQQLRFPFAWPASLVGEGGKCRGGVRMTLVSSPPLDSRFGAEFVRINIEAALQQEQPDNSAWRGEVRAAYLPFEGDHPVHEAELIEHGLKWSPVKTYSRAMPRGIGKSSNWRLVIDYLERAGEQMPEAGVPFTVILTIEDMEADRPVFNEMRQALLTGGVQISDIRTAARVTPRV